MQEGKGISNNKNIFVNYKGIANDICIGDKILLDDGKIILRVQGVDGLSITCINLTFNARSLKSIILEPYDYNFLIVIRILVMLNLKRSSFYN